MRRDAVRYDSRTPLSASSHVFVVACPHRAVRRPAVHAGCVGTHVDRWRRSCRRPSHRRYRTFAGRSRRSGALCRHVLHTRSWTMLHDDVRRALRRTLRSAAFRAVDVHRYVTASACRSSSRRRLLRAAAAAADRLIAGRVARFLCGASGTMSPSNTLVRQALMPPTLKTNAREAAEHAAVARK